MLRRGERELSDDGRNGRRQSEAVAKNTGLMGGVVWRISLVANCQERI